MSHAEHAAQIVFSHGKESGPWGHKITALAETAAALGFAVDSLDYRSDRDLAARIARLERAGASGRPLVLAGSSMGGYVSAMACQALKPDALFLMAPAFYLEGYPGDPKECPTDTEVIHGWDDDVVPLASSLAFAKRRRAFLHLVADDHRLGHSLDFLAARLHAQLTRVLDRAGLSSSTG